MGGQDIDQQHEILMMGLIYGLSENAWMLLGKRVSPVDGKEEVNLQAARSVIDTLGALKERTEGRLTARERSLLEQQLTNLRLNYVEVLQSSGKQPAAEAVESQSQD